MPSSLAEAREIADRHLSSLSMESGGIRILREEEFDVGWVFYYQSARLAESGDIRDSLVGNAPLFIARSDGKATYISYHRPPSESMNAYRGCGNPNGTEVPKVKLTAWHPGALAVSAIQLIRQHSPVGLAEAKRVVEDCLNDRKPAVGTHDVAAARDLVSDLASVGFVGQVQYDG